MTCWWAIYHPVAVLVVCSHLRLTVSSRHLYVYPDTADSTAIFFDPVLSIYVVLGKPEAK